MWVYMLPSHADSSTLLNLQACMSKIGMLSTEDYLRTFGDIPGPAPSKAGEWTFGKFNDSRTVPTFDKYFYAFYRS